MINTVANWATDAPCSGSAAAAMPISAICSCGLGRWGWWLGQIAPQLLVLGLGSPNTKPWMYLQSDPWLKQVFGSGVRLWEFIYGYYWTDSRFLLTPHTPASKR
jgi:hypothetical protein